MILLFTVIVVALIALLVVLALSDLKCNHHDFVWEDHGYHYEKVCQRCGPVALVDNTTAVRLVGNKLYRHSYHGNCLSCDVKAVSDSHLGMITCERMSCLCNCGKSGCIKEIEG